jgi:hypothetical protein
VRQVGDSRTLFRADFKAARSGELFLFVNDAMLPFNGSHWGIYDFRYFYQSSGFGDSRTRGNHGSACVTIESPEGASAGMNAVATQPANPVCQQTIERAQKVARVASGPRG